jgi:hypothetical protein
MQYVFHFNSLMLGIKLFGAMNKPFLQYVTKFHQFSATAEFCLIQGSHIFKKNGAFPFFL